MKMGWSPRREPRETGWTWESKADGWTGRPRRELLGLRAWVAGLGAILFAVGLIAPVPASATDAGGTASAGTAQRQDTITLTLDDALGIAEGHNPTYQQAVNSTRLNGPDTRQAWFDQILPSASFTLFTTGYTGNLTRRATDVFGNPIEQPVTEWAYFSNTQQGVNLSWSIQGTSIFNALRRSKVTNRGRNIDESGALTTARIEVRRMYMDALGQRALLEAEQELLEARKVDEDVTRRLFQLATGSQVDVLSAELAVEQQRQAVQQQQATFEKALLALRTELGDTELPPFRLDSTALPIFDPSSLDADALASAALDANPDLRRARSNVDLARVGVSESRASWWPRLTANLQINRQAYQSETQALFDATWNEPLDKRFQVYLSIPALNDFFRTRQSQVQASVQLDNAKEAARQQRLTVEQKVRGALLDLNNQWELLKVRERSAEIAAKALELARQEYRIGGRDFQQLRQSFQDDANARRQVIQSRHAFVDALLDLEAAVGTTVRPAPAGDGGSPGAPGSPAPAHGGDAPGGL